MTRARFSGAGWTVLALASLGVALLLVAEASPVIAVRTVAPHAGGGHLVRTVQGGPHHVWALVPIAVGAVLMAGAAAGLGGRSPLAGLGVLGLAALGVALGVDLPAVHSVGVVGSPATGLRAAQAHAAVGLYLETLGGVLLLVAAAAGALLGPGSRTPASAS